jgi:hypothetical protein
MGATEEQMALLSDLGVSHVAYILVIYSIAFLLFLFVCMLLNLYASHAWPIEPIALKKHDGPNGTLGGLNGQARDRDRRLKDAEEFELEGLMTDEEGEGESSDLMDSPTAAKETRRV